MSASIQASEPLILAAHSHSKKKTTALRFDSKNLEENVWTVHLTDGPAASHTSHFKLMSKLSEAC